MKVALLNAVACGVCLDSALGCALRGDVGLAAIMAVFCLLNLLFAILNAKVANV